MLETLVNRYLLTSFWLLVKMINVKTISRKDPAVAGNPHRPYARVRRFRRTRYGRTLLVTVGISKIKNWLIFVTTMSDSIRRYRSILEGSRPQYERTWLREPLVCLLSYQGQSRVATFLNDNRWKHLKREAYPKIRNRYQSPGRLPGNTGRQWKDGNILSLPVPIGRISFSRLAAWLSSSKERRTQNTY